MKSLTTSSAVRGAWVLVGGAAALLLAAGGASAAPSVGSAQHHHGKHLTKGHEARLSRHHRHHSHYRHTHLRRHTSYHTGVMRHERMDTHRDMHFKR
ncbi:MULTISPECIES: hypothetical protein [Streptomyces]|uniref:Uncharacterized protein n=1 Tax=Streptomyces silvisoli TaxID=3034235 RepID=A0ABT5ZGZ3_9ACTN|nr:MULTISPECIES: hypothetical protein [Streptomyces]MDF3289096.1 hypothetical protein [Streptomyces silvisoli]